MYLAKMTTAQAKEAFEKDPIIVIPVGSTEQHGTQGALGTDFMVPSYLADHVEDVDNVIVAPTVPYGVCASVDWWSLVAQLDKKFDGGHGDVLETSAMMAIAPSGWFGPFDPKNSSAELGQEALDVAVAYIREFLEEMKQMKL